jgi:hypothetical protein
MATVKKVRFPGTNVTERRDKQVEQVKLEDF